ncbi:MAG: DUF2075 domain-containing protein [bacterium]|nr:DUF2075 domain-containing protein [bacterium]
MGKIQTFPFERAEFDQLKSYHFGLNWPVVYILQNDQEIYIGETTNLYNRSKQHYENAERIKLKKLHVLTDEEFNMSSSHDVESLLIQYIAADNRLKLQNKNEGLVNHNYYQRELYQGKLTSIWPELQRLDIVKQDLNVLKNTDFFKFSPYKALTEEQSDIAKKLRRLVIQGNPGTFIINGGPGTGKSILALNLLKTLRENPETENLKIALVVPMAGLRKTYQKVVKRIHKLGIQSVIGPADVVKDQYDVLLVDEAHRLSRRVNLTQYGVFDKTNKGLGLGNEGTQLDWIRLSAKQHILFYDFRQTVTPRDVRQESISKLGAKQFELSSQMRVQGGEDYLGFIDDLLELKSVRPFNDRQYEFKLFEHIDEMISTIKQQDSDHSLARVVAGYAWPWTTKGGKEGHDIEIDGARFVWNRVDKDWVNSPNAVNEVGCIHTIQGYDLNYAGIIIGPELSYDDRMGKLVIDEKKYKDINGRRSISHPDELKQYIINIYKTLLTRGIKGTYVYVVDEKLRRRLNELISGTSIDTNVSYAAPVLSPITREMLRIPLVGSAPCGSPLLGQENIEEYILVEKSKIKPGFKYFILRAEGDSMNLVGINDGDLVLCRQQLKADTGDRVVALLGDNVTIKMYDKRSGRRILLPKSTNKSHVPITPDEGDSVQGVVQEVLEIGK